MLKTVASGAKIVHQYDGFDAHFVRQYFGVHNPWQIGRVNAVINDRASHSESGGSNFLLPQVGRRKSRKFPDNQIKLCKFLAGKALAKYEFQLSVFFRK